MELPQSCREALDRHFRTDVFRALSDPTRLALLARLLVSAEPSTVTEASDCCGVHISGVSRHLALLRDAGLVRVERRGREARYEVDCAALTGLLRGLADAIESCREACCRQSTTKESTS